MEKVILHIPSTQSKLFSSELRSSESCCRLISSLFPSQGEDPDEDDAYQVLSTLKRITAFHK